MDFTTRRLVAAACVLFVAFLLTGAIVEIRHLERDSVPWKLGFAVSGVFLSAVALQEVTTKSAAKPLWVTILFYHWDSIDTGVLDVTDPDTTRFEFLPIACLWLALLVATIFDRAKLRLLRPRAHHEKGERWPDATKRLSYTLKVATSYDIALLVRLHRMAGWLSYTAGWLLFFRLIGAFHFGGGAENPTAYAGFLLNVAFAIIWLYSVSRLLNPLRALALTALGCVVVFSAFRNNPSPEGVAAAVQFLGLPIPLVLLLLPIVLRRVTRMPRDTNECAAPSALSAWCDELGHSGNRLTVRTLFRWAVFTQRPLRPTLLCSASVLALTGSWAWILRPSIFDIWGPGMTALSMLFVHFLRTAPPFEDVQSLDDRTPVLFLRSYPDELVEESLGRKLGERISPRSKRGSSSERTEMPDFASKLQPYLGMSAENQAIRALWAVGPVKTFGRIDGERHVSLAAPFTVGTENWVDRARRECSRAKLVLVTVGHTPGISSEIDHICGTTEILQKTIFMIPPADRQERVRRVRAVLPRIWSPGLAAAVDEDGADDIIMFGIRPDQSPWLVRSHVQHGWAFFHGAAVASAHVLLSLPGARSKRSHAGTGGRTNGET